MNSEGKGRTPRKSNYSTTVSDENWNSRSDLKTLKKQVAILFLKKKITLNLSAKRKKQKQAYPIDYWRKIIKLSENNIYLYIRPNLRNTYQESIRRREKLESTLKKLLQRRY